MADIILKQYDYDKNETVEVGKVSTHLLARSLDTKLFSQILDDYLNVISWDFQSAVEVGKELRHTHRTLQRSAVLFALGILSGISEQEYTDARNETAINTAKKIKQMLENDELPVGRFI